MAQNYSYRDFDISFEANPITGDIVSVVDSKAIQKAVRNIILTSRFEKPFQPDYGGSVYSILFENYDIITRSFLQQEIANTIVKYEPRIYDVRVSLNDEEIDLNRIQLDIGFRVRNLPDPINVKIFLERVR